MGKYIVSNVNHTMKESGLWEEKSFRDDSLQVVLEQGMLVEIDEQQSTHDWCKANVKLRYDFWEFDGWIPKDHFDFQSVPDDEEMWN